jgi:hypothetical protein
MDSPTERMPIACVHCAKAKAKCDKKVRGQSRGGRMLARRVSNRETPPQSQDCPRNTVVLGV